MTKRDFRSKYLLDNNFFQKKYFRLFHSDTGTFYDMLTNIVQRSFHGTVLTLMEEVLPRLTTYFKKSQKNWQDSNIIFTNYFKIIPEIYSTFAIGDGIKLLVDGESESDEDDAFLEFWKDNKMDQELVRVFEEATATGYSGTYLTTEDEKLKFNRVGFESYYPEISWLNKVSSSEVNLVWIFSDIDSSNRTFAYVVNYLQEEDSVRITHKVFNYSHSQGFGQEAPEMISKFDTKGVLDNGVEENSFKKIPVVMMQAPRKDVVGLGVSVFKDIVGHIQDLSINETISSVELQNHFKSKVSVPESSVTRNSDGTAQMKDDSYFITGKNSESPKYITKDNPFFQHLYEKISVSKDSIASDTKIPIEILDKERNTGNEGVGLAVIRTKPFTQRIGSLRTEITLWINELAEVIYGEAGQDIKTVEIIYGEIIDTDKFAVKKDLREELNSELISRKKYLRESRPNMTEEEIEELIKEINDDLGVEITVAGNTLDGDIGDKL